MKPLVMLTNDDGWDSVGLLASWKAVKDLGETLIVAPESHMSGIGKAVTILRPLKLSSFACNEMEGFKLDGTPADCVIIGINKIAKRKPDLLVSGINLGPNLGLDDLTSSGTMGACLQAAMSGIPSICVSYCLQDYSQETSIEQLFLSKNIVRLLTRWVIEKGMPEEANILIVAVPETAEGETPEVREARLAISPLPDIHEEVSEGTYRFKSRILDLYQSEYEDDDVSAILGGNISITSFNLKPLTDRPAPMGPVIEYINNQL